MATRPKTFRMRMYADDEELKNKRNRYLFYLIFNCSIQIMCFDYFDDYVQGSTLPVPGARVQNKEILCLECSSLFSNCQNVLPRCNFKITEKHITIYILKSSVLS